MSVFSGVWVALVTPFRGGEVDHVALRAHASHLLAAGAHGLVACGSTGEAAALSEAEQLAVLDSLCEVVPAERLVMGLGGNNLAVAIARLNHIQRRPLAGVLVPAPCYVRPSQAGLVAWFEAIADASALPLVLYDIPGRTGVSLAMETLRHLARHPRVVAIKDCGGDLGKTLALIADGRLDVLSGEDEQMLATLCLGGHGVISASANVRTEAFAALFGHVQAQRLQAARETFYALLPLIRLAFAEPNPAPVKGLLARQGRIANELRAPMQPCSSERLACLEAGLR